MSFIELHFHLLPGIDDGPCAIEESVELARLAAAEGTQTIVATPHVNPVYATDVSSLPERVDEVTKRLRAERVPMEVLCGAELAHEMVGRLSQRELESIAHGPRGRRWLLLEAPLSGSGQAFTTAADELRSRGFAVLVAHPERSLASPETGWPALKHELAAGSAIQLNAWSLAGLYGDGVRCNALRLLRATGRAAIASDAHGPQRMPSLQLALDELAGLGDPNPARFVAANPHALLARGLPLRPAALAA